MYERIPKLIRDFNDAFTFRKVALTDFTKDSCESGRANAAEGVDRISAVSAVLARLTAALVDICGKKQKP